MGGSRLRISAERLAAAAEATGFRAELLEKVAKLLGLLDAIQQHPFLRGKLALKGGTALNLFVFDVPRLSVDIDLNYIGAQSREAMLAERPQLEEALSAVFGREELSSRQVTNEHAGSKWTLRYPTSTGETGRIDVDINYMYRVPLWPIAVTDSRRVADWQAKGVPVVDVHELAAGKLAALLARQSARDLFDSRLLFSIEALDLARLRTAFVVYGAMNRRDWRSVSTDDVSFDAAELASQLLPALRGGAGRLGDAAGYGQTLASAGRHCRRCSPSPEGRERSSIACSMREARRNIADGRSRTPEADRGAAPARVEGPERADPSRARMSRVMSLDRAAGGAEAHSPYAIRFGRKW